MSGFEVLNAGILSQIQDKGRFGFTYLGVCNSGVMDEYAYNIGNTLLLNDNNTNCIELSFSGLELKALGSTSIYICGADFDFSINGKAYKPWRTFYINKNDILKFNKKISGQKAYIGVKGGFLIKKDFNSTSTTIKEKLGGLSSVALKKGDFLAFNNSTYTAKKSLQKKYQPDYSLSLNLRVVLGYQKSSFETSQIEKFFSSDFYVTNDTNRMAIKLQGEKIIPKLDGIISEGISFGAIQIPKDGNPIILLKERQTIGGYVKMGSVLAIDCFKLSQAKQNTKINFEVIELDEAVKKMKLFYN